MQNFKELSLRLVRIYARLEAQASHAAVVNSELRESLRFLQTGLGKDEHFTAIEAPAQPQMAPSVAVITRSRLEKAKMISGQAARKPSPVRVQAGPKPGSSFQGLSQAQNIQRYVRHLHQQRSRWAAQREVGQGCKGSGGAEEGRKAKIAAGSFSQFCNTLHRASYMWETTEERWPAGRAAQSGLGSGGEEGAWEEEERSEAKAEAPLFPLAPLAGSKAVLEQKAALQPLVHNVASTRPLGHGALRFLPPHMQMSILSESVYQSLYSITPLVAKAASLGSAPVPVSSASDRVLSLFAEKTPGAVRLLEQLLKQCIPLLQRGMGITALVYSLFEMGREKGGALGSGSHSAKGGVGKESVRGCNSSEGLEVGAKRKGEEAEAEAEASSTREKGRRGASTIAGRQSLSSLLSQPSPSPSPSPSPKASGMAGAVPIHGMALPRSSSAGRSGRAAGGAKQGAGRSTSKDRAVSLIAQIQKAASPSAASLAGSLPSGSASGGLGDRRGAAEKKTAKQREAAERSRGVVVEHAMLWVSEREWEECGCAVEEKEGGAGSKSGMGGASERAGPSSGSGLLARKEMSAMVGVVRDALLPLFVPVPPSHRPAAWHAQRMSLALSSATLVHSYQAVLVKTGLCLSLFSSLSPLLDSVLKPRQLASGASASSCSSAASLPPLAEHQAWSLPLLRFLATIITNRNETMASVLSRPYQREWDETGAFRGEAAQGDGEEDEECMGKEGSAIQMQYSSSGGGGGGMKYGGNESYRTSYEEEEEEDEEEDEEDEEDEEEDGDDNDCDEHGQFTSFGESSEIGDSRSGEGQPNEKEWNDSGEYT
ncbi:uncharacterized protein MONOS_12226c2 [Monocercomonoides exilis]|uniref:uncharacterized protein n=1 Tax=Monocercomonoides exilis TaxID=2049356 RepID=UPI0035598E8B|nr:hypothetical protein MONOS_12226c1 [Monocercomonoides exilis]KAH7815578.1 hypothetical protein MONOS_12226c2 [Monocercomonoides exilis]|eukprot:MONOS_12226.1-p1 / transcript=MONOS_12226.1 / gene=MONOS_12226 / organism=Monocercomonoides_exilis_PA203 / gene_product=unspecified product / transcript_product=unspecified product / location=Mono_scaffold00662:16115-18589(+) / protein_length=825 / sequence_SO=supercontig / SO=protein_coding / is_pseudo=false